MKFYKIIFITAIFTGLFFNSAFATSLEFQAYENSKNGFYKKITDVNNQENYFELTKKSNYINAGGFYVESNPDYFITGLIFGKKTELKIKINDIISNIGGMKVQTGQDFIITGFIGQDKISTKIVEKNPVGNIDGINVQTGFKKNIEQFNLSFESKSVISNVSGMNVETDSFYKLIGKDTNLKITNFREEKFKINGKASDLEIAICVALRPFLLM